TSSFTMHWSLQSIKRGNRTGMKAGLTLTFLMGLTFLLTQLLEYARIGFTPHDTAFGTVFFSLTGLHGAHVFVGLTILAAMTTRAYRGHFSPEAHEGVEIGGIYWHFVDVMWIIVFTTVYVLRRVRLGHAAQPVTERSGGVSLRLADDRLLRPDRRRRADQQMARACGLHRAQRDSRLLLPQPHRTLDPRGRADSIADPPRPAPGPRG